MDDPALQEFLHVLSLDYRGSKTERIMATLSAVTTTAAAAASKTVHHTRNAALNDALRHEQVENENDAVGPAREGDPPSPAAAPICSMRSGDTASGMPAATNPTAPGLPPRPSQRLTPPTISAAARTTESADDVGAATVSSTELDMSPAGARADGLVGGFGVIAEAAAGIGKVYISGLGW